ncbi:MAG: hypothetical protein HY868_01840 [Chloroflexi bacterium]|nr:hypothetical protein [Chloroflexota bacterium]
MEKIPKRRLHSRAFAMALVSVALIVGAVWFVFAPTSVAVLAPEVERARCVFIAPEPEQARAADASRAAGAPAQIANGVFKLIGWNDLGMHCLNENFANLAVLPPFNTLWAQLIRQDTKPQIVTTGYRVEYSIVDNTFSACKNGRCKSNFWQYAAQLFPGSPSASQPEVGLTGARLSGVMAPSGDHFVIEGVPVTPYRDSAPAFTPQYWYPYQQVKMVAKDNATGRVLAETTTVAPVSTEMSCDTCHGDRRLKGVATGNVETNILALHDLNERTNLMSQRPVLCAKCHGSNALGMPGNPALPNLSRAMHNQHASATQDCYLCHPGKQTQCLRDVMYKEGVTCVKCHGGMMQVASPTRRPWIDLPRCETCHGSKFAENPNTLYRNSKGHGGMYCEACHGSPHAILPTIQPNDNIQNIALQGEAGTLKKCSVCHGNKSPDGAGPHETKDERKREDDERTRPKTPSAPTTNLVPTSPTISPQTNWNNPGVPTQPNWYPRSTWRSPYPWYYR